MPTGAIRSTPTAAPGRAPTAIAPPARCVVAQKRHPCVACMLWLARARAGRYDGGSAAEIDLDARPAPTGLVRKEAAHRTACVVTRWVTWRGCMVGLGKAQEAKE